MIEETFLRLAHALSNRRVTWGLAGGFAFSMYCHPRATVDIDVVLIGDLDTIEDIVRGTFSSVYRNLETMRYPLVEVNRFLLIDTDDETVLDVLQPTEDAFARFVSESLREINFDGSQIPVVAPEILYALKKVSSRQRDIADAEELESCLGDSLDRSAIARWLPM